MAGSSCGGRCFGPEGVHGLPSPSWYAIAAAAPFFHLCIFVPLPLLLLVFVMRVQDLWAVTVAPPTVHGAEPGDRGVGEGGFGDRGVGEGGFGCRGVGEGGFGCRGVGEGSPSRPLASRGTRTLSRGLLEQSRGESSREQRGPRRGYPGWAVPLPGLYSPVYSPGTSSHTGRLRELRIGRVRREAAGDHLGATRLPGRDCGKEIAGDPAGDCGRSRRRLREIPPAGPSSVCSSTGRAQMRNASPRL